MLCIACTRVISLARDRTLKCNTLSLTVTGTEERGIILSYYRSRLVILNTTLLVTVIPLLQQ